MKKKQTEIQINGFEFGSIRMIPPVPENCPLRQAYVQNKALLKLFTPLFRDSSSSFGDATIKAIATLESSNPIHVGVSKGRRKVSNESTKDDDLTEMAVTLV